MKGSRAASRYAKSLLELSIEQKKLEEVNKDMTLVSETISESRDLALLLKSPVVKSDQKQKILDKVFGSNVSEISSKFMAILINKRREELLEMIAADFHEQYKRHLNIVTAHVVSSTPLDKDLRAKVLKLVESTGGNSVDLQEKVDPSIIGGLIIRVGDKQIDASIARKINELKNDFSKNPHVAEF